MFISREQRGPSQPCRHGGLTPRRSPCATSSFFLLAVTLLSHRLAIAQAPPSTGLSTLPTPQAMASAKTDVWGEAALKQSGGPSYEFFRDLLPPLRYVNTEFRHYPIVLSAPGAAIKSRWVSNGSAINARANKKPMWKEAGFPVQFHVGEQAELFGHDLERLDGPRFEQGWIPIVRVGYTKDGTAYEQEAFASVQSPLASRGAVLVRFRARGGRGNISARLGLTEEVRDAGGSLCDARGQGLILFDTNWKWNPEARELKTTLAADQSAVLVVLTEPLPGRFPEVSEKVFEAERKACLDCWEALLRRGTQFTIPEPRVQDAWRALVVGNFLIATGNRMNYSAGNAYDHLYEGECGDATRSLMLFGFTPDARRMVGPLLDFNRQATRFHVAGHKLQLLAHYYWVTRDAQYLREKEKVWKPVIEFICTSRRTANGLLPKDNYAGDISQQIYSLNSNANCWRGLRDMAAALADMGEQARANELAREADDFRKAILDAVAKSEDLSERPPFIPMSLLGDEKPYETLTATRLGSYYDLMAPYILGSEIYGSGSEREGWMVDYLRQHGGIAMGMIRSMPHQGEFKDQPGVNVLYGLRYMLTLLRRDDRDHALVGFYGHLAQGMTRDTCIGGEGSRFLHGDRWGRSFYLPPNSASNAMFLTTLRYLLIQDWVDDRGRPDELRLLFGAPGRWFNDGAVLKVERAPTLFGEVSLETESRLTQGEVRVTVLPPPRRPNRLLIRLPLPDGWKVVQALVNDAGVDPGKDGKLDLTGRTGKLRLRFRVARASSN